MPRIIEEFDEFRARMGCDYIRNVKPTFRTGEDVHLYLFANGARSDGRQRHSDPPADPRSLLLAKREYVVAKLAQEEEAFERYKAAQMQQAAWKEKHPYDCPAPSARAPELLRAGQQRILKLRDELVRIDAQLVPPQQLQREEAVRELEAQERRRVAAIGNEISRISI